MVEPLVPREGWCVLHLFLRVRPGTDGESVVAAVKAAEADGAQVVPVALLGHKGDIGVMALAEDLWVLRRLQTALVAAGLELAGSYLSLTEVSEYAEGAPGRLKEARLHPKLPPAGKPAFCFYPMSKRRSPGAENWYVLPFDDRARLLGEHGATGRRFARRVLQLVTGSTGIDDWEWGVTLFAERPDDLKAVVYTMRYDEASARYADFGPFWTGAVASLEEVLALVGLGAGHSA
jgi:peroxiredoxin